MKGVLRSDTAVVAGGQLMQQALTILTGVLIARMLGAADYGVINILRNLYTALIILAPLGLDLALLKFVGREAAPSRDLERTIRRLRLITLAVNLVVVAVVGLGLGGVLMRHVYRFAHFDLMLLITLIGVPIAADLAILGAYYRSRRRPGVFALMTLYLQPVVRVVLVLAALAFFPSAMAVVAINTIQVAVSGVAVLSHHAMWRRREPVAQAEAAPAPAPGEILRQSIWMALNLFVYGMMRFVDILMLGAFAPAAVVGEYAALSTVSQLVQVYPLAASQTLGPTVSHRYHAGDMAGVRKALSDYIRMAAIVAGYMFAGIAAFGDRLHLVFGNSFSFHAGVAFLMPLGYLLSAALAPMGYALSMTGRHKAELAILAAGGVCLVALCALLIPPFGQIGAASAVAAAFTLINLTRFVYVARTLGFVPGRLLDLAAPVLALACAFGAKLLLDLWGAGLAPTLAACVLYSLAFAIAAYALLLDGPARAQLAAKMSGGRIHAA